MYVTELNYFPDVIIEFAVTPYSRYLDLIEFVERDMAGGKGEASLRQRRSFKYLICKDTYGENHFHRIMLDFRCQAGIVQ